MPYYFNVYVNESLVASNTTQTSFIIPFNQFGTVSVRVRAYNMFGFVEKITQVGSVKCSHVDYLFVMHSW
jgi:hypothetical protein